MFELQFGHCKFVVLRGSFGRFLTCSCSLQFCKLGLTGLKLFWLAGLLCRLSSQFVLLFRLVGLEFWRLCRFALGLQVFDLQVVVLVAVMQGFLFQCFSPLFLTVLAIGLLYLLFLFLLLPFTAFL